MPLYALLAIIFAISGLTMGGLVVVFKLPWSQSLRIREEKLRKLKGKKFRVRVLANMIMSAVLVYAACYGLHGWLFTNEAFSWWSAAWQSLTILGVYDVLYYFMHRYPFHQWKWLQRIHAVHHAAKYPTALDSMYMHPVENIAGLVLLFGCTLVIGPVHIYTFGLIFTVYSLLNIVIHSGMNVQRFGFRYLSYMARKHDRHHVSMRGGNYASLTPICDIILRTHQ